MTADRLETVRGEMAASRRDCATPTCTATVPAGLLMCGDCWALVPKDVQKAVVRTRRKSRDAERLAVAAVERAQGAS